MSQFTHIILDPNDSFFSPCVSAAEYSRPAFRVNVVRSIESDDILDAAHDSVSSMSPSTQSQCQSKSTVEFVVRSSPFQATIEESDDQNIDDISQSTKVLLSNKNLGPVFQLAVMPSEHTHSASSTSLESPFPTVLASAKFSNSESVSRSHLPTSASLQKDTHSDIISHFSIAQLSDPALSVRESVESPIPDSAASSSNSPNVYRAEIPVEYWLDWPRYRSLFERHAWIRVAFVLWILACSAAMVIGYPKDTISLSIMMPMVILAWITVAAHLVTSGGILYNSFTTFEAGYLIVWMLVWLADTVTEYAHDYQVIGGSTISLGWFIVQSSFFIISFLSLFVSLLAIDALPGFSKQRIWVYSLFCITAPMMYVNARFIDPDSVHPLPVCFGKSPKSLCTDTFRLRTDAIMTVSAFFVRNIINLLRFGDDHRFLFVKSKVHLGLAVIRDLDSSSPDKPAFCCFKLPSCIQRLFSSCCVCKSPLKFSNSSHGHVVQHLKSGNSPFPVWSDAEEQSLSVFDGCFDGIGIDCVELGASESAVSAPAAAVVPDSSAPSSSSSSIPASAPIPVAPPVKIAFADIHDADDSAPSWWRTLFFGGDIDERDMSPSSSSSSSLNQDIRAHSRAFHRATEMALDPTLSVSPRQASIDHLFPRSSALIVPLDRPKSVQSGLVVEDLECHSALSEISALSSSPAAASVAEVPPTLLSSKFKSSLQIDALSAGTGFSASSSNSSLSPSLSIPCSNQNSPKTVPKEQPRLVLSSNFHDEIGDLFVPASHAFGIQVTNLWSFAAFRLFFIAIHVCALICYGLGYSNRTAGLYFLMSCILFGIVVIISLIDLIMLKRLMRTFEFWYLQMCAVVYFVASVLNTVHQSEQAASYHGVSHFNQFWGDTALHLIFWFSAMVLISFDATISIRRRIKLVLCLLWILNSALNLYQNALVYPERFYFRNLRVCIPLSRDASFHISSGTTAKVGPFGNDEPNGAVGECFSLLIIRLQVVVSLMLFSCKHAYSLFRHPHALIILRSSISFRLELPTDCSEPNHQSAVSPASVSSIARMSTSSLSSADCSQAAVVSTSKSFALSNLPLTANPVFQS